MVTTPSTGGRPVRYRHTEAAPDIADSLALMLTARRRRHLHRTAWTSR